MNPMNYNGNNENNNNIYNSLDTDNFLHDGSCANAQRSHYNYNHEGTGRKKSCHSLTKPWP